MPTLKLMFLRDASSWICLGGYRMRRILSADLFLDVAADGRQPRLSVPATCLSRWADLAASVAMLPEPAEFLLTLACVPGKGNELPVFDSGLLAIGRARTRATARRHCHRVAGDLHKLFSSILDYAEFEPVDDPDVLGRLTAPLAAQSVTELVRRQERVRVAPGRARSATVGGFAPNPGAHPQDRPAPLRIMHLFPWVPSDDPWWRLVDIMAREGSPSAMVVHGRGWATAPEACRTEAHEALDAIDLAMETADAPGSLRFSRHSRAAQLRDEAQARLTTMEGPQVAARVFLATGRRPSSALLSVVASSLDYPSGSREQTGGGFAFRGGARFLRSNTASLHESLETPRPIHMFSPGEATAFLRTPMPTNSEYPGFPLNRARTAPLLGEGPGDDAPLGLNVHRGPRRVATMDTESRYRHCYVIGQTGTGKTTLLLHKVMHDIRHGRGVAVLDPHGALIDDILLRYPRERAQDLIIVDMTDHEYPVGFNPLYITDTDPVSYRTRRDLIVDELYGFLERTYDMKVAGGPVFEAHFRSMMGLLMGLEAPQPPAIPSLLAFRMLYTNVAVRMKLTERIRGRDHMLEEFVREASAAGGEASLPNMAGYITSKLSRFIADANLRNITCQNRTIDFDDVINSGKVLLFNLGRGHIGDHAAGLLASQVVGRIHQAAMSRGCAGAAHPFHLYADEFQLFASSHFAEMLAEGRKFGLSVTVAHP